MKEETHAIKLSTMSLNMGRYKGENDKYAGRHVSANNIHTYTYIHTHTHTYTHTHAPPNTSGLRHTSSQLGVALNTLATRSYAYHPSTRSVCRPTQTARARIAHLYNCCDVINGRTGLQTGQHEWNQAGFRSSPAGHQQNTRGFFPHLGRAGLARFFSLSARSVRIKFGQVAREGCDLPHRPTIPANVASNSKVLPTIMSRCRSSITNWIPFMPTKMPVKNSSTLRAP